MGGEGRDMVQRYIEPTVAYYRTATCSDNHAVREAACACIAELASKLDPAAVKSHVHSLLDTLLACFRDDSWPVRDGESYHLHKSIPNFTDSDKDSDFCINDFRLYSQFLFQALKVSLTSIYNFPFTSEMVSKLPLDFRFCITRKELNKRT